MSVKSLMFSCALYFLNMLISVIVSLHVIFVLKSYITKKIDLPAHKSNSLDYVCVNKNENLL